MVHYIKNGNTEKLISRFDEVLAGNFSYTTILGDAGTGKSYLIEKKQEFFEENSHFVGYKSNKNLMKSFATMEGILTEIAHHIFTLPPEEYKQILNTLVNEHMVHYETLFSFSPAFSRLLSRRVVRRQVSTRKDNLISVLLNLFETLSEILHPLVLFFDDVQWIDLDSLLFLKLLSSRNTNIYIVLAARPNELSVEFSNSRFLNNKAIIRLKAFELQDTTILITKMMDRPQGNDFVETLYLLTGGNPFLTYFSVNQLMEEYPGKKNFSKSDLSEIEILSKNSNVLLGLLTKMSEEEMHALSLLACVDHGLNASLINKLGINSEIIEHLLKKNLLTFINDSYMIVHDIVKYAVYDVLSNEQLKNYHFVLLNSLFDEHLDNQFYVYLITKSDFDQVINDRAEEYLKTVIEVAITSREKGDIHQSLELLKLASRMQKMVQKRDLDYIIKINTMECEYINENVFYAQALYNELLREFPENNIETKMNYISFYAFNAEWEKVLELGNELLKAMGHPLTRLNQLKDIIYYKKYYSNNRIKNLDSLPRVEDPNIFDTLEVLTIMIPASNRINMETFNRIALKLSVLVAKYGYSDYSSIGYAMASLIQYFVFKNIQKGDAIQAKIISLLNEKEDQYKSIPYALLGTFTHHWSNPFKDSLELLQKSYDYSGKDNEFLFSNYALVFYVITLYVNGSPLININQFISGFSRETSRLEDFLLKHMFDLYSKHLDYLRTGFKEYEFKPELKHSFDETIILNHKMLQVHQLYLENRIDEGFILSEEIDSLVWAHEGFVLNGHFAFYSCLTRISYFKIHKNNGKEAINKLIKFMSQWKDEKNIDHLIQYKVALFEWKRAKGESVENLSHEISELLETSTNMPLHTTVYKILANYYRGNKDVERVYRKKIYNTLIEWGAQHIAELYRVNAEDEAKEIPKLMEIKEYINMSDFEVTKYYVDYLLETSSVSEIGFCFERNDNLYLQYRFSDIAEELDPTNINVAKGVPRKELRYAFRAGEEYYKDGICCLPLKEDEILSGAVYFYLNQKEELSFIKDIINTYLPIHSKKKLKTVELAENLTKREIEILQLVSLGHSNEEISNKAFVTIGTIRNHLSSVYRKLSVSNRVQAIITAKELGIIE